MFQFTLRNTYNVIKNARTSSLSNELLSQYQLKYFFAKKKKKVIQLNTTSINISSETIDEAIQIVKAQKNQFFQLRKKIQSLPWEEMPFNELCNLDQELIDALQTSIKKDKFNISDQEFINNELKNGKEIPIRTYGELDKYYKKIYSLLKNTNNYYEEFPLTEEIKKGYLNEVYITDLKSDQQLTHVIARFLKNMAKPQSLQALAEPTFVKYLLSLKRQLLLQGIHFQTKAEKNQSIKKGQKIIQSNEKQQLPKVKILQILNYEYEFWQDVKHNRAKNGNQENFVIQTKQTPNPNHTILIQELYPTVKIKYIARKRHLKDRVHCFCFKADLLVEIDGKMKRKIKIEWKGPSNSQLNKSRPYKKNSNSSTGQEQEYVPRVQYKIIDYEEIYDGNPTIRPIFYF